MCFTLLSNISYLPSCIVFVYCIANLFCIVLFSIRWFSLYRLNDTINLQFFSINLLFPIWNDNIAGAWFIPKLTFTERIWKMDYWYWDLGHVSDRSTVRFSDHSMKSRQKVCYMTDDLNNDLFVRNSDGNLKNRPIVILIML